MYIPGNKLNSLTAQVPCGHGHTSHQTGEAISFLLLLLFIYLFFLAILVQSSSQWPHLHLNPDFTRKLVCFNCNMLPAKRQGF